MGTLRKPRRPTTERQQFLELRAKAWGERGAFLRFIDDYRLTVYSHVTDAPQVGMWLRTGSSGGTVLLDEEEVGMLVKGLLDALQAAKATVAARESQEGSHDG